MTIPSQEISQELVPDPFGRSSTILRSSSKSTSLKAANQGRFRKVNKCGSARNQNTNSGVEPNISWYKTHHPNHCFNSKESIMFQSLWIRLNVFLNKLQLHHNGKHTSLELAVKGLRYLGIWCMDRTRENSSYKIYNKVILAVTNIFVITATCDLCGSISDYENFLDGACILTAFYMILYKRIEFHVKQSEIEKIINILHKRAQFIFISANERNRKKYCEYLQEEYALIILLGIIAFTLSSAFTFQPLLSHSSALPFRAKYPFSTEAGSYAYIFIYLYQSVCCFILIFQIYYMDTSTIIMVNQACLYLEYVCDSFRNLGAQGHTHSKIKDVLGRIVHEHQRIISLINYINEAFHHMLVVQVISSTSLLCLTGYEVTVTNEKSSHFKYIFYMFSALLQIFFWCFYGNRISHQSSKVAEAAYNCMWIGCPKGFINDLQFIIMRGQKPLAISAYPFYDFDFESFIKILSASCSYFTLIRTLNQ
ncbi:putative odorant receptor 92a [Hermetia illucens]|uniref:putative odorant receptor 92a n=1 Tax=Hermetia illucens TaxID=343691 RepID=UPI0018CC1EDC|nr:putative odorant receptor 92a [Hermetia illucens]